MRDQKDPLHPEISDDEVLQRLQEFAINNGRVPEIDESSMQDVIEDAVKKFGSFENALCIAGLLVEPSVGVPSRLSESPQVRVETLSDVVIRLLDGSPMRFGELREKLRQVPGFGNTTDGSIGGTLSLTPQIRSTGSRGKKLYFLREQENLAVARTKAESPIKWFTVQKTPQKVSSPEIPMAKPGTREAAVARLLDGNPLSLPQLLEKAKKVPELASARSLVSIIFFSRNVKWTGPIAKPVYYVVGQEKLAEDKLRTSLLRLANTEKTVEQETDDTRNQEIKPWAPATLEDAIIGFLREKPMTIEQILKRAKEDAGVFLKFSDAPNILIMDSILSSKKIMSVEIGGRDLYFLKEQESDVLHRYLDRV